MHDTSQVGSLFRTTPPPETHYTAYRAIEDSLCTFLRSPFVLEHRLACSIHVHNPPLPGSGQQARIQPLSFPFPIRMPTSSRPFARYVRYKSPSHVVGVTSAHHGLCHHVLSQHCSAAHAELSCIIHTNTPSLLFFSPLSPSRLRSPFGIANPSSDLKNNPELTSALTILATTYYSKAVPSSPGTPHL